MSDVQQRKEQVAQEKYGKSFEECTAEERLSVGGTVGGETRREQLGTEGYKEMGHKGGETRREQLGTEGYKEMGQKGGQARKE